MKLAPLLDQGKVSVEGEMLEGNSKPFVLQLGNVVLTTRSRKFQIQSDDVSPRRMSSTDISE